MADQPQYENNNPNNSNLDTLRSILNFLTFDWLILPLKAIFIMPLIVIKELYDSLRDQASSIFNIVFAPFIGLLQLFNKFINVLDQISGFPGKALHTISNAFKSGFHWLKETTKTSYHKIENKLSAVGKNLISKSKSLWGKLFGLKKHSNEVFDSRYIELDDMSVKDTKPINANNQVKERIFPAENLITTTKQVQDTLLLNAANDIPAATLTSDNQDDVVLEDKKTENDVTSEIDDDNESQYYDATSGSDIDDDSDYFDCEDISDEQYNALLKAANSTENEAKPTSDEDRIEYRLR